MNFLKKIITIVFVIFSLISCDRNKYLSSALILEAAEKTHSVSVNSDTMSIIGYNFIVPGLQKGLEFSKIYSLSNGEKKLLNNQTEKIISEILLSEISFQEELRKDQLEWGKNNPR